MADNAAMADSQAKQKKPKQADFIFT